MKVINVDVFGDLTVDTMLITCDSEIITCDMTISDELTPIEIVLVPRIKPVIGDILSIYIRRELTDDEYNTIVNWNYENGYLHINFPVNTIPDINGSKYEIILRNDNNIIYRGKMILLSSNDSVQDYRTTEIVNKKLKF